MPVYRLVIAYDGAGFHGFARQPDDLPTVQGALESALGKLIGAPIRTSGAGRTDAGVHALGQVVSFTTDHELDVDAVKRALNAICGPEIAVLSIDVAPEGFDARFSASARTYEYAILTRSVHDPFARNSTWHHPGPFNVASMREAARQLLGEHSFESFGRVETGQTAVRNIESIEIDEEGDLLVVRVTANSFVQQMVRSIVGTLVKVGEGKIKPNQMNAILESRDRSKAGPVAPPQGLFLVSVSYPEELSAVDPDGELAGAVR